MLLAILWDYGLSSLYTRCFFAFHSFRPFVSTHAIIRLSMSLCLLHSLVHQVVVALQPICAIVLSPIFCKMALIYFAPKLPLGLRSDISEKLAHPNQMTLSELNSGRTRQEVVLRATFHSIHHCYKKKTSSIQRFVTVNRNNLSLDILKTRVYSNPPRREPELRAFPRTDRSLC